VDGRLLGVLQLLNKAGDGFDDFDEQLIQVFAGHAATALERRRLLDEARQSQQFAAAFETARGIQVGLLPQQLPTVPGYRLAALWQPAEFVSGDYYDWLQLPDGRLAIVVGDVSGHGIGAALLMASVRAMLHVLVRTHSTPEAILSLLHEGLVADLRDSRFITLVMATVDPVTHAVRFANAGHAPALHYRAATDEFVRLQATSLPIGFPQIELPSVDTQLSLEPGDLLMLGTDGIVEVANDAGDLFRTERLMDLVRRHHRGGPQHLVRIIGETIQDYHGKPLLPDDCTLVVLERQADSPVAT
jgi:phosphoserine phosphatase RsbU/P